MDFAAYDGRDGRQAAEVLDGRVGHYVAISTGQVYLVREGCPRPAREVDYDGPLSAEPAGGDDKGQWDYGVKKRGLEDALAEAWSSRRFPSTRLRLPMVNGERDHYRRIERYLWRFLDGGPVLLPGGGDRRLRHVYSGSVVKLVLGILGERRTFGEAYNLAQAETPTLREMLGLLAERLGARPPLVGLSEIALVMGMGTSRAVMLQVGTLLLLITADIFVVVIGITLLHARSAHATVWAMGGALLSLLITVLLGSGLLLNHDWRVPLAHSLTDLHLMWGLIGWVAALVIGVAFQVVPMFQLTPDYPRRIRS